MAIKSEDVAFYLREHPEFFSHYAEFLDRVVPQSASNVVSMAEEKMQEVSTQNRHLEGKLNELLNYGEENDRMSDSLHRLAVALLGSANWHAILQLVDFHLKEMFQVPFVALRLWGVSVPDDAYHLPAFTEVSDNFKRLIMRLEKPTCGFPTAMSLSIWDDESARQVKSEALIPLKNDGDVVGVLVLASDDLGRFYAAQGTLYLSRLAELISAALFRPA